MQINDALEFPPLSQALDEPNGLLAVGGDLSIERLLLAYRSGIFPWYSENQPILWWSPDPRAVLYPDQLHIARRLQRYVKQHPLNITFDQAFLEVMQGCAAPRKADDGTWILPEMQEAYHRLFEAGYAHSVEVWQDAELIGGLYGVAIGQIFFAESMFSRQTNASKLALIALCHFCKIWNYQLIDCQMMNAHLKTLGVIEISRDHYLRLLKKWIQKLPRHDAWTQDYLECSG